MSFPKYPAYKDSGIEWLRSVPSHWLIIAPKRLMKSSSGGTLIKGECSNEPSDELFPAFSASGQDVWIGSPNYSVPGIVLSAVGARCGKTFKADGQWGVVANTHCLFPSPSQDRDYFWYLTNQEEWWEKGGTAQPFVKVRETLDRPWCFPPLEEQITIREFLDRETAKIDALISEQQRLIALLQEKRQAVISHAVTKGLNPDAPMKDSGVEWLGQVPAHWKVTKLGNYATTLPGFAFPSSGFTEDSNHWRLLRGINVGVGEIRWDETVFWNRTENDGLDEFVLNEGDLVIGLDRPLISNGLRVARISKADCPCLLLQRVARVRGSQSLQTAYLDYLLSSRLFVAHFEPETTGVSVPHISTSQIESFRISVPPQEEQIEICLNLEKRLKEIASLVAEVEEHRQLLQERRSALISAAVTGQIDVRGVVEAVA